MADPKPKRSVPLPTLNVKKDLKSMMYTSSKKTAPAASTTASSRLAVPPTTKSTSATIHTRIGKNGLPVIKSNGARKSATPNRNLSRTSSSEPREIIRNGKASRSSRSSPAVHSPQFGPDSDEEDDTEPRRKRRRMNGHAEDKKRKIRDAGSFSNDDPRPYDIVHALDIANNTIQKHGTFQFAEYFTTLASNEDDSPTIELQYPCIGMTEKYQLVKPNDKTDFKPLDEIRENMKIVREFYLDTDTAEKIEPEGGFGGGLIEQLDRYARDTRPGAQTHFMEVIQEYNELLAIKRDDGTLVRKIDEMTSPLPLKLVNHIIKEQVYSRTISPYIDTVREYEGFSDNVYGELLPKFLSRIFQETHLTSDQIFVDLGSGVGNCVLQAALEIGCESWGCEVMANPAKLAQAAAQEFPSRCRMWGIKPGRVQIIQDDFRTNQQIGDVLKQADVVLVNNQAFNPDLNDVLKRMFLDLKEGCKIVSLKYFRDPNHKVKESNINDLVNCLSVQKKERFSGMVSWTDDPGNWYLHIKDSAELLAVRKRMERGQQGS
ncbi:Nucleosomal histone H3-Lys79 methylase [Lithohypha guttulata]|uniref:Histone-lysine N-methyltransferase, H3 lysine-79 specific n=1 Tax=Lithohypha guttulata TaxID=1690604 RepID=A0AAN7SWQ1_9EURO|nr:Nucleosomal histone H3-Lys79 methylase [Lithohypha guttulata]KAK5083604.1 Nucleosomal histone H3-Lys79 methylase [Lithohypha guttulata]